MPPFLVRPGVPLLVRPGVPFLTAAGAYSGGGSNTGGSGSSGSGSGSGGGSGSGSGSGGGGTLPTFTAVNMLAIGQSNAYYWLDPTQSNQGVQIALGVQFYLRAASTAMLFSSTTSGSGNGGTLIGGQGLYADYNNSVYASDAAGGSFLENPNNGTDPSTWGLGTDGGQVASYIAGLSSANRAAVRGIFMPWSEDDSGHPYTDKAQFKTAFIRYLSLVRGPSQLNTTNAACPAFEWSAMPFGLGTPGGTEMHREVMAELAADGLTNLYVVLPQTGDMVPQDATYDAATGTWTGGGYDHCDGTTYVNWTKRVVLPMARAILAAAGGAADAIPAAIGTGLGPKIVSATLSGGTNLTVTVQHDIGNDLVVQLLGRNGIGWSVMDGGTQASPGSIYSATACTRLSATTLGITLEAAPVSGSPRLFYPYGVPNANAPQGGGIAMMGRGNIVTDNASTISLPSGWDIGAALGPAWRVDMPLQAPMTVTDGVASAGIAITP